MKHLLYVVAIFSFILTEACAQKTVSEEKQPLIKGVSLVASREAALQSHIDPLLKLHANYAAVMPFGFIKDTTTPQILFNTDRQWFGETKTGVKQYIQVLHQNKIAVMLKPQIWIWKGTYTGKLKMASEEEWLALEASYRDFIFAYLDVAIEMDVELFCIGTELEQFIVKRPQFWHSLIGEIKKKYHGKLTYAANWDEYSRISFWKQLDYIGVDAYFPVSEAQTPTVEEARRGWKPWKEKLKKVAETNNKPILFTEFGYRSIDYAGKEPWKSDRNEAGVNLEAQTNLTEALFEELYAESWYAGGFIWKWYLEHPNAGGPKNNRFTPQNKPAEQLIKTYFKKE